MIPPRIRLVTFDALHTIITPRLPIYVQYSQVFAPYLGVLDPASIKASFKLALKELQTENPSYRQGAYKWWHEVIHRTALGAGADEQALNASLSDIVPILMSRFSSREGYKAFEDAVPTINSLHDELGIRTAVVSNGDSRIRSVLKDLDFPKILHPIVLSEEEGVEKPSREIFIRTLERVNAEHLGRDHPLITTEQCLHVGDELTCDYHGAIEAGMQALLLRRPGSEGEHAHKEPDEQLDGISVVENLTAVVRFAKERNNIPRS